MFTPGQHGDEEVITGFELASIRVEFACSRHVCMDFSVPEMIGWPTCMSTYSMYMPTRSHSAKAVRQCTFMCFGGMALEGLKEGDGIFF